MSIDPTNGVPLYLQIADVLRVGIASGHYSHGGDLPSLRELAADLRVNSHTVRRSFQILEEEGIIERQRGGRHRVVSNPSSAVPRALLREEAVRMARRTDELGLSAQTALELLDEALCAAGLVSERERA